MAEAQVKKRTFKKFSYGGVALESLLDLKEDKLAELFRCRARRKVLSIKQKAGVTQVGDKPKLVKTHARNILIVPEMIGSMVGIYNGKVFNQVEIKPEMIGHYLGEFSLTYKTVNHGRPGIGATHSSRFIPLKTTIITIKPTYR
ncbi:40S ribosomal protein S15 [Heterostelium album PN500]|uniref:40S ribosomal protein S15 n=1 Tax=Heterostelium pallidum (strain ATCC 26659 / Pp 5 / PN500) TaxID=670386 RepID=D3B437_HETP5|nr:40S ribosomal protein S15 [Heterostelium album PN500]EFA84085.1 40S ribosomal protein S15 [Heterostelium album PN500]|eukprot:XP_020436202.1 40S ribosomal protein S15 [Heterostelium album PN500]